MLDVLSYLAYNTTPIERERRAELLREEMKQRLNEEQQDFLNFMLNQYVLNGYKELDPDKLGTLLDMKYRTITDAKVHLQMDPREIRQFFLDVQKELYDGKCVLNATSAGRALNL